MIPNPNSDLKLEFAISPLLYATMNARVQYMGSLTIRGQYGKYFVLEILVNEW